MIIISGPSTVGKNPFIYEICERYAFTYVIPYTTRKMRYDELEGKDYIFLSKKEFQSRIKSREMNEWDYCLDNYYGYMYDFPGNSSHITHGLSRMALRIKAKYPKEVRTVFLMPDNKDRIYNNLKQIYSGKTLYLREALVEEELCHSALFDKIFMCSNSVLDLVNKKEVIQFLLTESQAI